MKKILAFFKRGSTTFALRKKKYEKLYPRESQRNFLSIFIEWG